MDTKTFNDVLGEDGVKTLVDNLCQGLSTKEKVINPKKFELSYEEFIDNKDFVNLNADLLGKNGDGRKYSYRDFSNAHKVGKMVRGVKILNLYIHYGQMPIKVGFPTLHAGEVVGLRVRPRNEMLTDIGHSKPALMTKADIRTLNLLKIAGVEDSKIKKVFASKTDLESFL